MAFNECKECCKGHKKLGEKLGAGEIKEPLPANSPVNDDGEGSAQEKIVIKLSDGKIREIQHVSSAMYWNAGGTPITAKEFLEKMFGDLPRFFALSLSLPLSSLLSSLYLLILRVCFMAHCN